MGKIDELKRQYIQQEIPVKHDKYGTVSPDKKNFEALSRQFSKSTVADIQYKSINKTENTLSPVTASLKKIAGNFNINMNLRSERVLPQSLTRPGQEVPTVLSLK